MKNLKMQRPKSIIEIVLIIIIIVVFSILISIFLTGVFTNNALIVPAVVAVSVLSDSSTDTTGGNDNSNVLLTNTNAINNDDIFKSNDIILTKKKKHGKQTYDEYDDDNLLDKLIIDYSDNFDNVILDGNNFIYKLYEANKLPNEPKYPLPDKYISLIESSIHALNKAIPDKQIFFVFKDPETDTQLQYFLNITKTKNIKAAHKMYFSQLIEKHPNVHVLVAYGDDKYRDDFAAIWLAEVLGSTSILLSRDRYRDVDNMKRKKIKLVVYGNKAEKFNKLINLPYTQIDKLSVKCNLVGYAFKDKKKYTSGFYQRNIHVKSPSSDVVLILN